VSADANQHARRRWPAAGALVAAALLLPAAAAAKPKPPPKPSVFNVRMLFNQTRDWSYSDHRNGDQCSSSTEGNGADSATLRAKAIFNLTSRRTGSAGLAIGGLHNRTGTSLFTTGIPNYPGADCGGPQTATNESTTGCGTKPPLSTYAALDLVGKKVVLAWESSNSIPDFNPCPYFDGAYDQPSSNALPGDAYRDLIATGVDPAELLKATKQRPAVYTGHSEISRSESCATLVSEPCAEGYTYDATATVRSSVEFYFTPRKKH
jgi:hypothetical protein